MKNNKILLFFVCLVLFFGTIYLGLLSWNAVKSHNYIGVSEEQRYTITVYGEGRVVTIPDIAEMQLGHQVEKKTVALAQQENTEKINAMVEKLKNDFNIEDKDIQTVNYNIYPQYDWSEGKQSFRGYQVSQNIKVKIREIDRVSEILDAAGQLELNQVGSLNFTIDDEEEFKKEARVEAIKAAKEKAQDLANVAGVKLGRIVSFSESYNQPDRVYTDYAMKSEAAYGLGGADSAPSIEAGSTEIVVNATVVYEIL